jgi:hypothetical protein
MVSDLKPKVKSVTKTFFESLFKRDPFELQPEFQLEHKVNKNGEVMH